MIPIEQQLDFDSIDLWHAWLNDNHKDDFIIWLRIKKVKSTKPGILLKDAVKEMLKFGWIDGRIHPIDEDYFIIRCTKRKSNSVWSMINRKTVEDLIESNEISEKGLEMVEIAKKTGAWDAAYSTKEPINIPLDLEVELDKLIVAKETFEQYSKSDKTQILYWINQAKRPETRLRRINRIVQLALSGKRITQL